MCIHSSKFGVELVVSFNFVSLCKSLKASRYPANHAWRVLLVPASAVTDPKEGPADSLRVAAASWKVSDSRIFRNSSIFLTSLNHLSNDTGNGVFFGIL